MNKIFRFLISLLLLVVMFISNSCTDEISSEPNNNVTSPNMMQDFLVSETEAIKIAESTISQLKTSTRALRVPISVQRIQNRNTRSNTESESKNLGYYIINYDNDNGFAIISADKRLNAVAAFSETGNCNIQDTSFNTGFRDFIASALDADPSNNNQIFVPDTTRIPINDLHNPHVYITIKKEPLLSYQIRRIHQKAPFNSKCKYINGVQCVVGCVPVACAQVMCLRRCPNYYNWNEMNLNIENESTYTLLKDLGNKNCLDVDYGTQSSSANSDHIIRTFYNNKYFNPHKETNLINLHSTICNEGLVIVSGSREDKNTNSTKRHCFIIDGYLVHTVPASMAAIIEPGEKKDVNTIYYHTVWGWGGNSDGWYTADFKRQLNTLELSYWWTSESVQYKIDKFFHSFIPDPSR